MMFEFKTVLVSICGHLSSCIILRKPLEM